MKKLDNLEQEHKNIVIKIRKAKKRLRKLRNKKRRIRNDYATLYRRQNREHFEDAP